MESVKYICDLKINTHGQVYLPDVLKNEVGAKNGDYLIFLKNDDGIIVRVETLQKRKEEIQKRYKGECIDNE